MSQYRSIANAVYREYDRRIKRASLVAEYGAHHHAEHHHAEDEYADATNQDADATEHEEDAEEAEIHNVPRGTPVVEPQNTQRT
jgi:nickel-dependent lactate racemase